MHIVGGDLDKTTFITGGNVAGGTIEIYYLYGNKITYATIVRQSARFRYSIAI